MARPRKIRRPTQKHAREINEVFTPVALDELDAVPYEIVTNGQKPVMNGGNAVMKWSASRAVSPKVAQLLPVPIVSAFAKKTI